VMGTTPRTTFGRAALLSQEGNSPFLWFIPKRKIIS
jgi:hypothetical protein